MDISNNSQSEQSTRSPKPLKPVSVGAKVFCCIVLLICATVFTVLPHYIGTEGINPSLPFAILLATLALSLAFILTLCKGKLFLSCALVGGIAVALLLGPWLTGLYAALLCASIAAAALTADGKTLSYLPALIAALVGFGISFALTRNPLLAACVLLPVTVGFVLSNSHQKGRSVIVSVGLSAGMLIGECLVLLLGSALLSGMQPTVAGLTEYVKAFHATVSGTLAETMQLMAETPEFAEWFALMLEQELTPELIAEFADITASTVIGILPGACIMVAWIFGFIAHRGFTALLVHSADKADYPAHLTAYEPSVPTALFMILCYATLLISSLFVQGEVVSLVALNLVLALMPLMLVCGILSIVSNLKQARVKWPLLLTYALSAVFLGIAVVPMIAFFGAFDVIMKAIARTLEQKFNDFKGEQ